MERTQEGRCVHNTACSNGTQRGERASDSDSVDIEGIHTLSRHRCRWSAMTEYEEYRANGESGRMANGKWQAINIDCNKVSIAAVGKERERYGVEAGPRRL